MRKVKFKVRVVWCLKKREQKMRRNATYTHSEDKKVCTCTVKLQKDVFEEVSVDAVRGGQITYVENERRVFYRRRYETTGAHWYRCCEALSEVKIKKK